ncbi:porin [Nitrosomonas sp.]|uniref:porin n=1 Tax=Nitrosomonas sp. TaxID=42353 RepID=UPI001DA75A6F|nr:porin [Nitrosomonas sp.]MCB1949481.1 porin [Nitrosomonas sp.]
MSIKIKSKAKLLIAIIFGSVLFYSTISTASYINKLQNFFQSRNVEFGGWINGGVTINPSQSGGYNGPVIFADQANHFQLNQLNLFVRRPVISEGNIWDIGGRFDFMFGTDAIYTQAFGVPPFDVNSGEPLKRSNWDLDLCCNSSRTYGIALPQAYLELHAPVGNGLNIKFGHFYTPTGFETVPAPDNFFYTRAYTLNVGEPFTHTGMLFNYTLNQNWLLLGGPITGSATGGWDAGWDKQLGNWAGLAGFTWSSDNRETTFHFSGTYGNVSTRSDETWAFYNVVLQQKIAPRTLLVLHHVFGEASGILLNNLKYSSVIKNARWISALVHLYHDLTNNLAIGFRAEWFRDEDGFRNPSPFRIAAATNVVNGLVTSYAGDLNSITITPADYYDITLGLNWKAARSLGIKSKLWRKLIVRSNIRYDRVDAYHTSAYRPFANHKDQILFSLDFLLSF